MVVFLVRPLVHKRPILSEAFYVMQLLLVPLLLPLLVLAARAVGCTFVRHVGLS